MSEKKYTILIVEDDPHIRKLLVMVLEDDNFTIIECEDGKCAVRLDASTKPDIILLDLSLPDMNGRDVITAMRAWCHAPLIILSGNSSDKSVVELLGHGADDYVIKPFNIDVLRARINAALRKSAIHETGEPELRNGPLRIDLARHRVFLGNDLIAMTPNEYNLLRYFIVHRGQLLSHKVILREVWGAGHSDDTQYLRVFVGQLRKKLEKTTATPRIITTELGVGYRMEVFPDSKHQKQSAAAA
jgi:two-component system KDP operon response regulator KdpE